MISGLAAEIEGRMKVKNYLLALIIINLLVSACEENVSTPGESLPDTSTDITKETDEVDDEDKYSELTGTKVFFAADRQDFYDFPFPANNRLTAAGYVDISDFPQAATVIDSYIELFSSYIAGFSTNGAIYFHFDGPLDSSALPTPEQSMEPGATIQLINIDPASENYGRQIPIKSHIFADKNDYLPENTLALMPYPGFPLEAETTYAALILRDFADKDGQDLGVPVLLQMALDEARSNDAQKAAIIKMMRPLATFIKENNKIAKESIAAATVFTTQNPQKELRAVRTFINKNKAPTIEGFTYVGSRSNYYAFDAYYHAPNFQQGVKPYLSDGGAFSFDENGEPIVAENEFMRVRFTVPKDTDKMGPNGWPIVIVYHGTTGDYTYFDDSSSLGVARILAEYGLAAMGISLPLHYERGCKNPTSDTDYDECQIGSATLILASFNVLNPLSGRTNFRQSAADAFTLVKILHDNPPVIPQEVNPQKQDIHFDAQNIFFRGHSYGGIAGAVAVSLEPRIKASFHSGAGGILPSILAYNKTYNPLVETFLNIKGDDLTNVLHPLYTLIQTMADVADPVNYLAYYHSAEGASAGRNILFTVGKYDGYVHKESNDYLTTAASLPVIGPLRWQVEGHLLKKLAGENGPVSGNCAARDGTIYTCGVRQYAEDDDSNNCEYDDPSDLDYYCGHAVVAAKSDATHMYAEFFYSYLHSGKAIINAEWTPENSYLNSQKEGEP